MKRKEPRDPSSTSRKKKKENLEKKLQENRKDIAAIKVKRDKKTRNQIVMGVIFTVACTVLLVSLLLSLGDMKKIGETFAQIAVGNNWLYLLAAFGLTMVYFILWPFSLITYCDALDIRANKWDLYAISNSEHFYNDVTPSATGGQPFQIYGMKTIGVDTSRATGAILATYATFLIVTNIYAIVALVFYPYYIAGVDAGEIPGFEWINTTTFIIISAVGYFANLMTLFVTILLGVSKHVRSWIISITLWLCKLKWVGKLIRRFIPSFFQFLKNTQMAFQEIITHKKHFLKAFISRFIAMGAYYTIPFFLLLAVGVPFQNAALGFIVTLFATSFAITAVVWVPTPGGTGGIEIAFALVLASLVYMPGLVEAGSTSTILDRDGALTVALLWRMFTYYFIMFMSFIMSVIFQIRAQRKLRRERIDMERRESELNETTTNLQRIKEIEESDKENEDESSKE